MRLRTFSLRTGLAVFILVGVALGLVGRWVQDVRRRGQAQLRVIAKCGEGQNPYASTTFQRAAEAKATGFIEWMRTSVHPEYGRACATLHLTGHMLEDQLFQSDLKSLFQVDQASIGGVFRSEQMAVMFQLPRLKSLTISGQLICEDDSSDWSAVQQANALETIDFSNHYLSDQLARELAKLPKLKSVLDVNCSVEALASIAELPALSELRISGGHARYIIENDDAVLSEAAERAYLHQWGERIFSRLAERDQLKSLSLKLSLYLEPKDLAAFCGTSQITDLTLLDAHLSPQCLAQFARLPKLTSLTITEDLIEDKHLAAIADATQLTAISIRGNTTSEGVDKLRTLLPNCLINGWRGPRPSDETTASANLR